MCVIDGVFVTMRRRRVGLKTKTMNNKNIAEAEQTHEEEEKEGEEHARQSRTKGVTVKKGGRKEGAARLGV